MSKSAKTNLLKYLSTIAIGLLMAWLYISSRWMESLSLSEKYCILCDAFSIPGLLLFLSGVLMWVDYAGGMDTIAYLMSFLPRMIAPAAFGEPEKLYDYVEKRRQNRKKGYGFLFIVGIGFLIAAFVFLALFNSAS